MKKIIDIAKLVSGNIDSKIMQEYLEAIYDLEKDFSFQSCKQTADYCLNMCKSFGLETRKITIPLDGETRFSDWIMPMAWDRGEVCLKVKYDDQTEQTLVDGNEIPHHLIQWSAGTPPEGITADLGWIDTIGQITRKSVQGKFVLTTLGVTEIKNRISECGGIGILSYMSRPDAPDNAVPWLNCWSDDPDGWAFTAKDRQLIGFSISNEQGDHLKYKLLSGQKITLYARVETRLFKDNLPLVEAEIKGTGSESVLLLAHLFEPGANDNASGVTALLEIARVLSSLIQRNILSRPSRSIKFLFTCEIYGTIGYFSTIKDHLPEILAALNVDSIGSFDFKTGKMNIHDIPDSSFSFISVFLKRLVELMDLSSQTAFLPFTLADTVSNDPQIGIPCPYLGIVDQYWHTSLDVPTTIDYQILSQYTTLSAMYGYFLATAGKDEALWLVNLFSKKINTVIQQGSKTESEMEYALYVLSKQVRSISRLDDSLETIKEIDDLLNNDNGSVSTEIKKQYNREKSWNPSKETVLKRRFVGPLSFLDIPLAERRKNNINVWNPILQKALFWINGERSLEEICRLTELEHGSPVPYLKKALITILENNLLHEVITFQRLVKDLKKIGLKKGDKVGVHSSLQSLGYVIGGAETVIKALLEVIGPQGTLLMPLFNEPAPIIDLATQPSRLGKISETFRQFKGVLRSSNATHSVGVIGADAEYIASGHENGTQLGVDSPFHRLAKMDGWILHLGTDFKSSSIIHVAEAIVGVPYLDVAYPGYNITIEYITTIGSKRIMAPKETPGDSITFIKVQEEMKKRELVKSGKIGMAHSLLGQGKNILSVACDMLMNEPGILLCDNPQCPVCPLAKKCISSE